MQGTDQGVFGTADARIDIANPGPNGVAADTAAARQRFGTVEAIAHETVPVPGSITPVDLRAQDPHGAFSKPMLRLVSGKYPTGPGEVAVTATVATTFSLKIGSSWPVNGRTLRVVGIVENPKDLQDAFGLVAPGEISTPSSVTLLFDASGTRVTTFHPPAGTVQGIMSSGADAAQQQRNQALAVLLLATIGLTFIGLLSVAGFTVMAQRRLRALGMIGAIGATDRQVRRVMLANGAAVGAVGAIVGAGLGLGVWFALTPAFERVVGHRYDPFALPWWAVIAGAILAILTALAASWWPARAAARLPIVAALSGRPAPPQPAHRFALLGTVLAAAGFVALVLAHAVHPVLIVVGILATTAGMLLLAPLGIRALAAFAARAPVAVRLALRDLARYQARSGAALAAASLAVGIAATIAVTAAAQQAHDHTLTGGNLPTNQLIVWLANPNDHGGSGLSVAPAGGATATPAVPNPAVVVARPVDGRRDRAGAREQHRRRTGQRRRPELARAGRGATGRRAGDVGPSDQRAGTRPRLDPGRDPLRGDPSGARPLPDTGRRHRRGQRHPQRAPRPGRDRARNRVQGGLPARHGAGVRAAARTTPRPPTR